MSVINEFLIKSAGMEKEAKRALFRALEKGITSFRRPQYTNGMAAVDLKTPLLSRVTNYLNRSLHTPVTEAEARAHISTLDRTQKRELLSRMADQSMSDAFDAWNGPDNKLHLGTYVANMNRYNPQLGKSSRIYKRFLKPRAAGLLTREQRALADILTGDRVRYDITSLDGMGDRAIPTLITYKSKVPFASTHHVANESVSLAANNRAREAAAVDPTVRSISNIDPDKGWRNWRADEFAVNIPGRPWAEEQLKLMRESKNLSNTPLYETVFALGAKDYPAPTAVYVPNKKWIREVLGIPDDVKLAHIDDIQSPVQGIVYKGRQRNMRDPSAFADYFEDHPLDVGRVKDLTGLNLDRAAREVDLTHVRRASGGLSRWFAPAARTSWGYVDRPQEMIRLSGDQIGKLRAYSTSDRRMENYMKQLQEKIDTAKPHDLKAAATRVFANRKYNRDSTRIANIIKALSSRLNLPEEVIPYMLLA